MIEVFIPFVQDEDLFIIIKFIIIKLNLMPVTSNLLIKKSCYFIVVASLMLFHQSCYQAPAEVKPAAASQVTAKPEVPEFYNLRPEVEKLFGYSHAVKIGNKITVSGAVSMDDKGQPTALGNIGLQMKNCYADLEKILTHFGCTFDDVVTENIFTTNMPEFIKQADYRNTIYKKHFPAGSWLGVKELALPGLMIEIELEVHKVN